MKTTKKNSITKMQNRKKVFRKLLDDDTLAIVIQNKSGKRVKLRISYEGAINSNNFFSLETKIIVTGDIKSPLIYFPYPLCEKDKVTIKKVTFYLVLADDDYSEREFLESEYNKTFTGLKYESQKTLKSFRINFIQLPIKIKAFAGDFGTKAVYTVIMN